MSAASIARLKITLDDVKPAVLRRIEVPLNCGSIVCILRSKVRWAGPTATSTRFVPAMSDGQ
jgi:hypothetical protein